MVETFTLEPTFNSVYKVVGNCIIETDVYLPPDLGDEPVERPVLIHIHGGSFAVGHSGLGSKVQFQDCLDRGFIVVSPDFRLCPQVKLVEGPITDTRDLLRWVVAGSAGLDGQIELSGSRLRVDASKLVAFGGSSGCLIAENLIFGDDNLPPLAAIMACYGAKNFSDVGAWGERLSNRDACPAPLMNLIMSADPVPTRCRGRGDKSTFNETLTATETAARHELVLRMKKDASANYQLFTMMFPDKKDQWMIDPPKMVGPETVGSWPATWLVHGTADQGIDVEESRNMHRILGENGVRSRLHEFEGLGHGFILQMKKGDEVNQRYVGIMDEIETYLRSGEGK